MEEDSDLEHEGSRGDPQFKELKIDQCPFVPTTNVCKVSAIIECLKLALPRVLNTTNGGFLKLSEALSAAVKSSRLLFLAHASTQQSFVQEQVDDNGVVTGIQCVNGHHCIIKTYTKSGFRPTYPVGKYRCCKCLLSKGNPWFQRECSYRLVCDWCALQTQIGMPERHVVCKSCLKKQGLLGETVEGALRAAEDIACLLMHIHLEGDLSDALAETFSEMDISNIRKCMTDMERLSTFHQFWFSFLYLRAQDLIEDHGLIVAGEMDVLHREEDHPDAGMVKNVRLALAALYQPKLKAGSSGGAVLQVLQLTKAQLESVFYGGGHIPFSPTRAAMDLTYWGGGVCGIHHKLCSYNLPAANRSLEVLKTQPPGLHGIYGCETGDDGKEEWKQVWFPVAKSPFRLDKKKDEVQGNLFGPLMALWTRVLKKGEATTEQKVVLLVPSKAGDIMRRGVAQWGAERSVPVNVKKSKLEKYVAQIQEIKSQTGATDDTTIGDLLQQIGDALKAKDKKEKEASASKKRKTSQ